MTNITITTEKGSMTNAGHIIKVEDIIGTIITLQIGTILEMIVVKINMVEVIRGILRIETGYN